MWKEKGCDSWSQYHGKVSQATGSIEQSYREDTVQLMRIVNPLFAFAFLDSFLQTLREYLGEVTESTIKENFDIVYMVSSPLVSSLEENNQELIVIAHRRDVR